jgi:hypothetical protein
MNIQRKYSLPNCTLLLEGLSDVTISTHLQELRPELSILVNAECYLSSYSQPIAGGREFFESLVRTVSAYAQEFLSNVPNPQAHNRESELVEFQKIDTNHHQLIVHSEIPTGGLESQVLNQGKEPAIQVDLNTVQLFDLVEAVDQFFADTQTLPELSLELQPITRRYSGSSQGVFKQVVPASVGISSLAVAAVAFSLIPPPQVRLPEPKSEEQTSTTIPTGSPTPTIKTASTASPIASRTRTTSASASVTPIIKDLEALVNSVPEITDPSQLRALNRQVYNQINPVWSHRSEFTEDLIYRLGVAADGSIIGYKAVSKGSNEAVNKTPLPKILYNPATRNITNEPIAQFRVVFTKLGVLEVSPWGGYVKTPEVIGEKITDSSTVRDLNRKLYNTIRQNWSATPTFSKDLKYRVAVNKGGVIADYEPLNQVAFDFFRETPLPQMFQSVYGSNLAAPNNKEALAHFQVIFNPSGTLEVKPWQGYR